MVATIIFFYHALALRTPLPHIVARKLHELGIVTC